MLVVQKGISDGNGFDCLPALEVFIQEKIRLGQKSGLKNEAVPECKEKLPLYKEPISGVIHLFSRKSPPESPGSTPRASIFLTFDNCPVLPFALRSFPE